MWSLDPTRACLQEGPLGFGFGLHSELHVSAVNEFGTKWATAPSLHHLCGAPVDTGCLSLSQDPDPLRALYENVFSLCFWLGVVFITVYLCSIAFNWEMYNLLFQCVISHPVCVCVPVFDLIRVANTSRSSTYTFSKQLLPGSVCHVPVSSCHLDMWKAVLRTVKFLLIMHISCTLCCFHWFLFFSQVTYLCFFECLEIMDWISDIHFNQLYVFLMF